MKHLIKLFFTLLIISTTATAWAQRANKDFIAATVDQAPITAADVEYAVSKIGAAVQQNEQRQLTKGELYQKVLELLVLDQVQLNLAQSSNITVSDQELADKLEELAQQNNFTIAQLQQQLHQDGDNWQRFVDNVRNQLIFQKLRAVEIPDDRQITRGEIKKYLHEQTIGSDIDNFDIAINEISINVPANANSRQIQAAKKKIIAAYNELKSGTPFTEVLRSYTPGKKLTLGFLPAKAYPQSYRRQIAPLTVGQIAPIFQDKSGFHILQLVEKARQGSPAALVQRSHVRHIIIAPNEQITEEQVYNFLLELRQQIQNGKITFADAASMYSQDGSKAQGGDLGFIVPGVMVPEFEEVINSLPIGQISTPFQTRFGYHLAEVFDRQTGKLSQPEIEMMTRAAIAQSRQRENFEKWLRTAKDRAVIEYLIHYDQQN